MYLISESIKLLKTTKLIIMYCIKRYHTSDVFYSQPVNHTSTNAEKILISNVCCAVMAKNIVKISQKIFLFFYNLWQSLNVIMYYQKWFNLKNFLFYNIVMQLTFNQKPSTVGYFFKIWFIKITINRFLFFWHGCIRKTC